MAWSWRAWEIEWKAGGVAAEDTDPQPVGVELRADPIAGLLHRMVRPADPDAGFPQTKSCGELIRSL